MITSTESKKSAMVRGGLGKNFFCLFLFDLTVAIFFFFQFGKLIILSFTLTEPGFLNFKNLSIFFEECPVEEYVDH